jgi:hypothetical protein
MEGGEIGPGQGVVELGPVSGGVRQEAVPGAIGVRVRGKEVTTLRKDPPPLAR